MSKLVININDGTVCELAGTVIVDTDKLNDEGKALLQEWEQGGNDSTISELGEKYGNPVSNGLTYGNTMAFSGKALRDEVSERLEMGFGDEAYKVASTFTDEQFDDLGQYILSSDHLWQVFNDELRLGIIGYANDVLGKDINNGN